MEYTTVIALDTGHLDQFRGVWPTWRRFKPELIDSPFLCICDTIAKTPAWWHEKLSFLRHDHRDVKLAFWDWPNLDDSEFADMSQRERMLTSFVKVPPATVETPYWLKIDTDTMATAPGPWIEPHWFDSEPAIISNPWPYSKPADVFHRLNLWATGVPALSPMPALELDPLKPGQETYRLPRIISWLCFIDTIWSRTAADYSPGRLPVPSQDTYHFYVALREEQVILRERFGKRGWAHIHSDRRRKELIKEVMHNHDTECCG